MKNKVCVITTVHSIYDPRIFYKEALSLSGSGYDVTLVAPHDCNEIIDGIRIVALPQNQGRLRRFLRLLRPLRPALREKAEVYHVHDPELLVVLIFLRFLTRAKLVYDVHENLPMQVMSKYWIPAYLRRPVATLSGVFEKVMALVVHGIIAATPTIAKRFPSKKVVVVQNLPITNELLAPESNYGDRPNILTYVGAITRVRGIAEMVEAMSLLPPSFDAQLVLCGKFSPLTLEKEMASMPGAERVTFLGWKSRNELAEILGQSRVGLVLLHPEENYMDAQPTKLFEYMAAGIPAVASDFPLWRQFVEGAECGILVDPLKPSEIAKAIRRLLEHPDEARQMGEGGNKAVLEKYNWEIEAGRLLGFYASLTH